MNTNMYTEKQIHRIAHIRGHRDGKNIDRPIYNIEHNQGDPRACVTSLSDYSEANAMLAWFENHDLNAMRQWWHVSAKLLQMYYKMGGGSTINPGAAFLELLRPLISNNEALIDWFSRLDQRYDMKRVESHKTWDFWAYQGVLALRGEWQRLIERCERIISDSPKDSGLKRRLTAHHFYLALAHGDIAKMEEVLQQMVTPKILGALYEENGGYTKDLISTSAVIYAKIAWRHGYEVKVDSPFVPQEWLPMEPLAQYDNHFSFLK